MNREKQLQDFKKEVEKLREIDNAEEYTKQLAHLFLGNGLSLQTILLMAIDFGQQHPNWISVEDELPKEENLYIVSNGRETSVAYWVDDNWDTFGDEITHWMQLPQPPQGKEE